MPVLTDIWRYPIKGHGRERLTQTSVVAGRALPFDRKWAVAHDAAKLNGGWAPPRNFSITAKTAALMPIEAQMDEASGIVTLIHPEAGTIALNPDDPDDQSRFIAWVTPLVPDNRAQPQRVYSKPGVDMTDSDFPSISIASHASRRAVEQKFGRPVVPERFRINLWIDQDLAPWEEFDWIGKTVSIGDIPFRVEERIERCASTMANPQTGLRDLETLRGLDDDWGHHDFGIRVTALGDGQLAPNAVVTV